MFINFFVCLTANAQRLLTGDTLKITTGINAFNTLPIVTFPSVKPIAGKYFFKNIPADYYTSGLSFFCKKELQIEKAIKFPVKMRLGNVPYTDKLEGKITARSTE